MDKTVKIRSFDGKEEPQEEKADKPNKPNKPKSTPGLVIKNPQLEEERAKSQEYLKKIEQLEKSLQEEKVTSATLADALKKISSMAIAATQTKNS